MLETPGVSFSVQSSFRICIGPLTILPYSSSNGENPLDACGTSLYANRTADKYLSQSLGFFWHVFFNILLRIHSFFHTVFGFNGVVNNCLSDITVRKTARISNRYNQVSHLSQITKWESNKITKKHHKQEPRGQPFPFR